LVEQPRVHAASYRCRRWYTAAMDINQAVAAVEGFVTGFVDAAGHQPVEVRTRPSGDDADHIKVWVDLGAGVNDAACDAWAAACKAAANQLAGRFTLEVRAESL
jgi:hypothetical protein